MGNEVAALASLLAVTPAQQKALKSPSDFEPLLKAGLSSKALHHVHQAMSMTVADFAVVMGVSPRSVYGMLKRSRIGVTESDRLFRIALVIAKASALFGDRRKAVQWMHSALPALAGATPFEKLATEVGTARVHEVLAGIEHGLYV